MSEELLGDSAIFPHCPENRFGIRMSSITPSGKFQSM